MYIDIYIYTYLFMFIAFLIFKTYFSRAKKTFIQ